jgi:signal transduction histidine kinase
MKVETIPETRRLPMAFIAFLAFALSLGLTLYAYQNARSDFERLGALAFENEAQRTLSLLRERLAVYENLVFAAKGFVEGSQRIERAEWATFAASMDLKEKYPGVSALGYLERVPAREKASFLEEMRREGFPGLQIHPAGEREEYWAVKFVEPLAGFEAAIGFDAASDPERRLALERAAGSGEAAITRRIELVSSNTDRTGFAIYVPFFSRDPALLTEEERRASLRGFVSGVFKSKNVFEGIFERRGLHPLVRFEVFTEGALSARNLIYSEGERSWVLDPAYRPKFFTKKVLRVADRPWRIYFAAKEAMTAVPLSQRPVFFLFVGTAASFLIALLVFFSLTLAVRTRKPSAVTTELTHEREERLRRDLEEARQREEAVRKMNEELELRVMERTAELEAFSYSVSHDLRSPLIAINGFTSALLEDYGARLDEEARTYLGKVAANSKNMGALIDDLLAFSRLGRQAMTFGDRIDMGALAREVFDELCRSLSGRDIEFRVKALPVIKGDRSMMRQVWQNLLSNAVKYTRDKPKAVIEVGSYAKDGENAFYVKDNGAGFDMEYRHKLFQVFQRLHSRDRFEGTGVGLAIVQRVLSRHGGHVWAEGKEGEGATFYFAVPTEPHFRERDETWLTSMKSRSS